MEYSDSLPKWFDNIPECGTASESSETDVSKLYEEAKQCWQKECEAYKKKQAARNKDYHWMVTLMNKGTVGDRIAAHTILIQDNPVVHLEVLENLVLMVRAGKRKVGVAALETLGELFINDLLIPGKKLENFTKRACAAVNGLGSGDASKRRKLLSLCYFEDSLKVLYSNFLDAVKKLSLDTIEINRVKSVSVMNRLLNGNPENEEMLLSFMVNKLGDPRPIVSSKALYCLQQLLVYHPRMQCVIFAEVERLMFRPNVPQKAQYYGLCLLSGFIFDNEDEVLASKITKLYFAFFKACIKKGEVNTRMMTVLLMGVNRAFPFSRLPPDELKEHIETLYRVVYCADFNIGVYSLCVLYHVARTSDNKPTERFYAAIFRRLRHPFVLTTTRHAILFNLIFKALMEDDQVFRIRTFIKRLLQIAIGGDPSVTASILYMISQLMHLKKKKHGLDVKAFTFDLQNALTVTEPIDAYAAKCKSLNDEHNRDPNQSLQITFDVDPSLVKSESEPFDGTVSEVTVKHEADVKPDVEILNKKIKGKIFKPRTSFDAYANNPLFAAGEFSVYTELLYCLYHYHPTVRMQSEGLIMRNACINHGGDPLRDYTLSKFLERFVFKNPKQIEEKKDDNPFKRRLPPLRGAKAMPVQSMAYMSQPQTQVPADEMFLYKYMRQRYGGQTEGAGGENTNDNDDDTDLESVQSEEFEEMLEKMGGDVGKCIEDGDVDFMCGIDEGIKQTRMQNSKRTSKKKDSDMMVGDLDDEDDEANDDYASDESLSDEDVMYSDVEDVDKNEIVFDHKETFNLKSDDLGSLFASADTFATMLEDEGLAKRPPGTSQAFRNDDHASGKQIAWEEKRNFWLKGYKKSVGHTKNVVRKTKMNTKQHRSVDNLKRKKYSKQARNKR